MFTYKCGDLNWGSEASIGFSAADDLFANHDFAGGGNAHLLDCENIPASDYVNVVYRISSAAASQPPISPDTGTCNTVLLLLLLC